MKKVFAIVMATIMALCCIPAYAEEVPDADVPEGSEVIEVINFDITPDMVNEDGTISIPGYKSVTLVDNTWNFTNYHQGSNRSYAYSTIGFKVQITDSNGNAVSDTISIELHDTYTGGTLYYTAYANGAWYWNNNISIVANRTYYFYYENLSSSTRTMKIHMVIYH